MRNLQMNSLILMALLLMISISSKGQSKYQFTRAEKKIIDYAKGIDASKLDAKLPKQSLVAALEKALGRDTILMWEVNDCGEQSGYEADRRRDFPMCVGIDATLPVGRKVLVRIAVGTQKKAYEANQYYITAGFNKGKNLSTLANSANFFKR